MHITLDFLKNTFFFKLKNSLALNYKCLLEFDILVISSTFNLLVLRTINSITTMDKVQFKIIKSY